MQYALLIYNPDDDLAAQAQRPIDPGIAAALERPGVTGWIRLHATGSATTVRCQDGRTLLTDGPFIDSKEFLGGLILVEADNLDGALAIAADLTELRPGRVVAIEVRPVRE
ncbi:MAG TPA: YciI family protein [Streptosporangiaceae bacterium]